MTVHAKHAKLWPLEDQTVKMEGDEWDDALKAEVLADRVFMAGRFEGPPSPKKEEEDYLNYIKRRVLY
jgi:hypothetical protein